MIIKKQDTKFVSEIDQFFHDWDNKHPDLSKSQQQEIRKHQRIADMRDKQTNDQSDNLIWQDF